MDCGAEREGPCLYGDAPLGVSDASLQCCFSDLPAVSLFGANNDTFSGPNVLRELCRQWSAPIMGKTLLHPVAIATPGPTSAKVIDHELPLTCDGPEWEMLLHSINQNESSQVGCACKIGEESICELCNFFRSDCFDLVDPLAIKQQIFKVPVAVFNQGECLNQRDIVPLSSKQAVTVEELDTFQRKAITHPSAVELSQPWSASWSFFDQGDAEMIMLAIAESADCSRFGFGFEVDANSQQSTYTGVRDDSRLQISINKRPKLRFLHSLEIES